MKLISSRERYRCGLFWVTEDRAVDPDGFEIKRSVVQHAGSAVMMAVDGRGRLLLVRQYRLPARAKLWELPAGRLDPGEKPLQAARRELEEETGYRARRWSKLLSFYPSPGYIAEKMTVFLATSLIKGEPRQMPDERIQSRWFTPGEISRMIRTGRLIDGKTIAAFLLWQSGRAK
ncbi:MAG: NUDIX hydrolase [Bryobacterales bacterium]|nr:NUDIX hydrolase [Bryobacterales bacterium]